MVTILTGIERPFGGGIAAGQGELIRTPAGVTANTVSLFDVGTTPLTSVTATIHCASIILPENLPVSTISLILVTAGTVTGFWYALIDAARVVKAVSANSTTPAAGYFPLSVLPASGIPTVTPYAGLYYVAWGTVSSAASTAAAMAALPSVAAASGPPVYCGTSATAATTTPPPVGTVLGALTGVATNEFYAQLT